MIDLSCRIEPLSVRCLMLDEGGVVAVGSFGRSGIRYRHTFGNRIFVSYSVYLLLTSSFCITH